MFFPTQVQPNARVFLRSDGSLHIEKTVPEDAGNYVCTAVNVAGSMNITVSLEVHGEKEACWGSHGHFTYKFTLVLIDRIKGFVRKKR